MKGNAIKKRKSGRRVTRRHALSALAVGAGAVLAARAVRASDLLDGTTDEEPGQWVSWDDGWTYPITGYTLEGWWIVQFDDGEFGVDPSGWVFDSGVWYLVVEIDAEGIWYAGDDGYDYLMVHGIALQEAALSA